MSEPTSIFAVNLYSYIFDQAAADRIRRLGDQGYRGVELMMYPGHLWPKDLDDAGRRELQRIAEASDVRIVSLNMPNIDLNVAGASQEMRDYSLGLVSQFVRLAGDLGAPEIVIGPGKANPSFRGRGTPCWGTFSRLWTSSLRSRSGAAPAFASRTCRSHSFRTPTP